MERYNQQLKQLSRSLRSNMTEAEQALWHQLRRKQIQDLQFYRQKPLLSYIVDFYCPAAKLVIELDGSQHLEADYLLNDKSRDATLAKAGLHVMRFDNRQVLLEMQAVLELINEVAKKRRI